MFCIPIVGPTVAQAEIQIKAASFQGDLVEFRLDLWDGWEIEEVQQLKHAAALPVIFKAPQASRYECVRRLAALGPDYLDIDYETNRVYVEKIACDFPKVMLILSYHNFTHTPTDLEALVNEMRNVAAHYYKIACQATSTMDALRMLDLIRSHAPLLGISMGEYGQITRVVGPLMGAAWTYAALSHNEKSAPGQLTLEELRSIYAIERKTRACALYGLIGSPVDKSIGHYVHNRLMQALEIDALYIKMAVEPTELSLFFTLARRLGMRGLSVTMPLKEAVIPYLDALDESARDACAVNTIAFESNQLVGYNTDGEGAFKALAGHLQGTDHLIAIIGSGGAARAISAEVLKGGARVHLFNRTRPRAEAIVRELRTKIPGCEIEARGHLEGHYHVIINTTPLEIPVEGAISADVAMDLSTKPPMTPFLKAAQARGCRIVFGYEMFIHQALGQWRVWSIASSSSSQKIAELLAKEVLLCI